MKIPYSWLKDYVALTAAAEAVAGDLVRLGHEIEGVELPRAAVQGVRVGLIRSKGPHPDADKLSLLKVDIGEAEPLDIVCGASNMTEGDKVPVATIGTSLPNGLTIKKGKIRGETSCGMCCSETELGLAAESAGLLILPKDAPVGAEVGEFLALEEAVFDLSITPNRGDCMNVRGVARDLAADAGLSLAPHAGEPVAAESGVGKPVVGIDAIGDCPLYLGRRIEGVKVADAPAWIASRLIAAGQRPVNGIVDVLNYIMLDMGQPMHAFDADTLSGGVNIRSANDGESFKALDGREVKLADGDLVVTDEAGVIALAGIMGSEPSGVTDATTSIMLEAAFFRPARVSLTRRRLAMVSEASMRFERGIDPAMVAEAMQRATRMIVELFGGRPGEVVVCGDAFYGQAGRKLECSIGRIESRLGVAIPASVDEVLVRMGFGLTREGDALHVGIPSFRHDVTIPEDLSEEYARVIGFDAIPAILPPLVVSSPAKSERAVHSAVQAGFVQVVGYAFIAPAEQRRFIADATSDIALANPISEDMAVMRRSLWPGLLKIARHNLNRQQPGVALVEQGRIYNKVEGGHSETDTIAWLLTGEMQQDAWHGAAREADFFDLKGAVEGWLSARGLTGRFIAEAIPGLQRGQSAKILVGRSEVGQIGRVDAAIAEDFDIDRPVFVASIELAALPSGKRAKFVPLPEFPSVERDLVFLFDRDVVAEEIIQTVSKSGGRLLSDARIFDRYAGKGVPQGKVSLGIRFALQDGTRTLTQDDSDTASKAIVAAVEKRFAATLRA
ncbi:MAG: phenylalanine--tRNA ligase subunit beta [Zetaproteobacteria bacterium CG06_land_8_20_14_3_00_59_53]|nr:MAG: phenylalanine--tRNA ligase subunit beta [Zetaproteobacteria bacterium CG23_combo_of_CG06-09_8_20_14_all_59_86]PIQ65168.1 MAG: phenylalanine--tRNA ligase subunit beta [Zetaproteobacteria bacterium CG11_big_fil_rev_8_21_14_0_20_59_439]PIU70747.1 MAG: phenylalanine--tRNA ligase subunit beta [Zetaproteobacteria bacterium CG06_land_8_20_14_3_00_59_53]PIU96417.1 MAG: phenylalanine--tRNA ligase subunit beta [Zetaproteobacteria bacterium CG03_land_8_20_14_0_80_59_51]PIY45290.1 MAG: phenylalanin